MAKVKKELAEILARYDLKPDEALWDCHGTLVIYHKTCELIAAKAGITFDPPQIIEARSGDKIVAICAVGRMGDRSEWSIGEAAPGNNKNAYPYAMAEKRAKDRVILKLAGLSAYIHSEEEAEDFKDKPKGAVETETKAAPKAPDTGTRSGQLDSTTAPKPGEEAIARFWKGASYELPGNDLLSFAVKFVKAAATCPHPDALLKFEDDNADHLAAIKNGSASEWQKVQTAISAARKRLTLIAA